MQNNKLHESVLKLRSNIKRYLKVPSNQFNEISYRDIATILTSETYDYTEIIYRFRIDDLKKADLVRAEQKRTKLKKAEQEKTKLKKAELKKAIAIERTLNGKKPCDFCGEPISNGHVKFVNITHNPATHYFCKKECKRNFLHQLQKNNS